MNEGSGYREGYREGAFSALYFHFAKWSICTQKPVQLLFLLLLQLLLLLPLPLLLSRIVLLLSVIARSGLRRGSVCLGHLVN